MVFSTAAVRKYIGVQQTSSCLYGRRLSRFRLSIHATLGLRLLALILPSKRSTLQFDMEGTQGSVEVAEVSEYELRREVRMAENSEALRAMGFDEIVTNRMSTGGTKSKNSQQQRGPKRPSNSASVAHQEPPRTRQKSASGAAATSGAAAQREKQDRVRIKRRAQHDGAQRTLVASSSISYIPTGGCVG